MIFDWKKSFSTVIDMPHFSTYGVTENCNSTSVRGFRHMQITSTTMIFANETVPEGTMLAGYAALIYALKVEAPLN